MFQIGKANFNEKPNNTVIWSCKRKALQFGKCRKLLAALKWLIAISLDLMKRCEEDRPEAGIGAYCLLYINRIILFWEASNKGIRNPFFKKKIFRLLKQFLFVYFWGKKCMTMFSKCGSCPLSHWIFCSHDRIRCVSSLFRHGVRSQSLLTRIL